MYRFPYAGIPPFSCICAKIIRNLHPYFPLSLKEFSISNITRSPTDSPFIDFLYVPRFQPLFPRRFIYNSVLQSFFLHLTSRNFITGKLYFHFHPIHHRLFKTKPLTHGFPHTKNSTDHIRPCCLDSFLYSLSGSGVCFRIHAFQFLACQLHIDLCCGNVGMSHHLLHGFQICTVFDHMRRKGMPQHVRCNILLNARLSCVSL